MRAFFRANDHRARVPCDAIKCAVQELDNAVGAGVPSCRLFDGIFARDFSGPPYDFHFWTRREA